MRTHPSARLGFVLLFGVVLARAAAADSFVAIKGGTLRAGIRPDDFELCDHPVTNAEFKIQTNTTPIAKRGITRLADHEYRTWLARKLTSGYGSYFEWQPKETK